MQNIKCILNFRSASWQPALLGWLPFSRDFPSLYFQDFLQLVDGEHRRIVMDDPMAIRTYGAEIPYGVDLSASAFRHFDDVVVHM